MKTKEVLFLLVVLCSLVYPQYFERGFGYSGLVCFQYNGPNTNNDIYKDKSISYLYSEKAYEPGNPFDQLYSPFSPPEYWQAYLSIGADLNGDGIDELVTCYSIGRDVGTPGDMSGLKDGLRDESVLIATRGEHGEELWRHEVQNSTSGANNAYLLTKGDFNGDGRDEVLQVRRAFSDVTGDGFADGSILEIYDLYKNITVLHELQDEEGAGIITFLDVLDFNGDHNDDIVFCKVDLATGLNNEVILIDVRNNNKSKIEINPAISITGLQTDYFNDDPNEDIVFSFKIEDNSPLAGLMYYNSTTGQISIPEIGGEIGVLLETGSEIINLTSGKIDDDNSADVVFAVRPGLVQNSYDASSKPVICAFNLISNNIMFSYSDTESSTFNCKEIICGNFLRTGNDEVLVHYSAFTDPDGDGEGEGSLIRFLDQDGVSQEYYHPTMSSEPSIINTDPITDIVTGDFNGDHFEDIAMLINWGVDNDQNSVKDNSLLVIYDLKNGQEIYTNNFGGINNYSEAAYMLCKVDNDITDIELLRSINYEADVELASVRSAMLEKNYDLAVSRLLEFYQAQPIPNLNLNEEYYKTASWGDFLISRLRSYSTPTGKENDCYKCDANWLGNPSSIMIRLNRLLSSFRYRLINSASFSEENFKYLLKTMISHMNWFMMYDNTTRENNHSVLFELNNFIFTAPHLRIFKPYNSNNYDGWVKLSEERFFEQLEHILPDGLHDEHSIGYDFLYSFNLNKLHRFYNDNDDMIDVSHELKDLIIAKLQLMYRYLMYAVKPVTIKPGRMNANLRADFPLTGDSDNPVVGYWRGKFDSLHTKQSLLWDPYKSGVVSEWPDQNLAKQLRFTSKYVSAVLGKVPQETSAAFTSAGFFVSRSNWVTEENTLNYDENARYLHFKGGEIIPAGGPYDGFTTNSKHGHADLLSVDIAAYNKNLIIDPGGYITPALDNNIDTFDVDVYTQLYRKNPPQSTFDMIRSYFKETAVHSTISLNRVSQLPYKSDYNWYGIGAIHRKPLSFAIRPEFDFFLNGYMNNRTGVENHHDRAVVYLKPKVNNKISNDYWIIIDKVSWGQSSFSNIADLHWHISPEQTEVELDEQTGVIKANNFVMIPFRNTGDQNFTPSIKKSYCYFDSKLIPTKIAEYTKENSNKRHFHFVTVIFPHEEGKIPLNINLVPVEITDEDGAIAETEDAFAFELSYTTNSGEEINDYFAYINKRDVINFWQPHKSSDLIEIQNKRFVFYRYVNEVLEVLSALEQNVVDLENDVKFQPAEFALQQNFPNPFNNSTTIRYSLNQSSEVKLTIYNVLGQKVLTIVNDFLEQGVYANEWRGENDKGKQCSSGMYIYELVAEGKVISKKMLYLK